MPRPTNPLDFPRPKRVKVPMTSGSGTEWFEGDVVDQDEDIVEVKFPNGSTTRKRLDQVRILR